MRYDMSAEYAGSLSLITEHCAEFLSEEEVEQVLHGTAGALQRQDHLLGRQRGDGVLADAVEDLGCEQADLRVEVVADVASDRGEGLVAEELRQVLQLARVPDGTRLHIHTHAVSANTTATPWNARSTLSPHTTCSRTQHSYTACTQVGAHNT